MMANWLATKRNWLLGLLIFSLPINLFKAFPSGGEYLSGLRVDYLIPKLYLADIVVVLLLIALITLLPKPKKSQGSGSLSLIVIGIGLVVLFAQILAPLSFVAVLSFIKVVLAVFLMIVIGKNHQRIHRKIVVASMALSLIWQAFLAIYQWVIQRQFLPYFLSGETKIDSTIFTAKSTLIDPGQALPYGSTAHPNILAGFAAIYGIGILSYWLYKKQRRGLMTSLILGGLISALTILALTESVSALLTFFGGSYLLSLQRIRYKKLINFNWHTIAGILAILLTTGLFALSLRWPDSPSISRRVDLLIASATLAQSEPVFGIGASQFTYTLNEMGLDKKLAPFVQPVHHGPMLFFTEFGLLGLSLIALLAYMQPQGWFSKKMPIFWLAILPILIFDHYLVSLAPGIYLLVLIPTLWQTAEN